MKNTSECWRAITFISIHFSIIHILQRSTQIENYSFLLNKIFNLSVIRILLSFYIN